MKDLGRAIVGRQSQWVAGSKCQIKAVQSETAARVASRGHQARRNTFCCPQTQAPSTGVRHQGLVSPVPQLDEILAGLKRLKTQRFSKHSPAPHPSMASTGTANRGKAGEGTCGYLARDTCTIVDTVVHGAGEARPPLHSERSHLHSHPLGLGKLPPA